MIQQGWVFKLTTKARSRPPRRARAPVAGTTKAPRRGRAVERRASRRRCPHARRRRSCRNHACRAPSLVGARLVVGRSGLLRWSLRPGSPPRVPARLSDIGSASARRCLQLARPALSGDEERAAQASRERGDPWEPENRSWTPNDDKVGLACRCFTAHRAHEWPGPAADLDVEAIFGGLIDGKSADRVEERCAVTLRVVNFGDGRGR